jgi:hypothetical protein
MRWATGLRGPPRLDRALTAKTGAQTDLKMKRSAFSQSTERENEAVPLNRINEFMVLFSFFPAEEERCSIN